MPNYEAIPQVHAPVDEEAPPANTSPRSERGGPSLRVIIGGMAVMASILVAILAMHKSSSAGASTTSTTMGNTKNSNKAAPPCTFKECNASNCNHIKAPYTCLFHNGGPHGGCSPTPWITGTCTTQCDLTHCAELDIPKDAESCDDTPCEKDVCTGDRLCEHDVPYQCTAGSAKFGCSEGKFEWTFHTSDTTCSSCCNAKSCKKK